MALLKLRCWGEMEPDGAAFLRDALVGPKRWPAGSELVRQDTRPSSSTILVKGFAARVTTLGRGAQQISALHVAGDLVDLHAFVLPRMDHSIVALTDCAALNLPHAALRDIVERYPKLTRLLWVSTCVDAAMHRQWIVGMGRRSLEGQIAHLVCELAARLEMVGLCKDGRFDLPLSQAILADVLGRSRASVNQAVQRMRSDGLLSWTRSGVEILRHEELVALAEFDEGYIKG